MPSAPAARPFFNRQIAVVTSCSIGTSSETVTSGVAAVINTYLVWLLVVH